MSEKTLKTLLGTLGGLVLLYAVVALASGGSSTDGAAGPLADAVAAVDAAAVDAVTIDRRGETVRLERGDDGWTVDGRPADSAKVAELWSALEEAGAADLAATNPANHARMGVADDSAWSIAFRTGDADPVNLLVGDAGPYTPSAYVRLPEADDVYLLGGELRGLVARRVDDWRDRRIVAVDTAAVTEVRVERDGESYVLARGDSVWTVDGEPADDRTVRDLLGTLARLDASGFAPDSVRPGEPDRTVTALSATGDSLASVRLHTAGDYDVRVAVPGRDAVFELPSWRADRLTPARDAVAAAPDSAGTG